MKRTIIFLVIPLFFIAACSSSEPIEVTRIVTETVEVEVMTEVTRIVTEQIEVTRVIEVEVPVEVTRIVETEVIVEVEPEPTEVPSSGTAVSELLGEIDLSQAIAYNYLGTVEQDGITVELARIIYMNKNAFDEVNFDENEDFDNETHAAEIFWRITNDTEGVISWQYDDIDARINGRQIDLYDWLFNAFGEVPMDDIYPGSTITGGVWFGGSELTPDEIETFSLIMGRPIDPDYHQLSSPFIVDAVLPMPHGWEDLPAELK